MDDLGFVLASYIVTFGAVAVYTVVSLRRSRRDGENIPPRDRPWT